MLTWALVAIAATFANIGLRSHWTNFAACIGIVAALAAVHRGAVPTRRSSMFLGAAGLVALWLPIRTSSWLAHLNGWTVAALIFAGLAFPSGPVWHPSVRHLAAIIDRVGAAFGAPRQVARFVIGGRPTAGSTSAAVMRGLILALIPVVVFAVLLSQGDAVFRDMLNAGLDLWSALGHVATMLVLSVVVVGLIRIGRRPVRDPGPARRRVGVVEALVVLGSIAALFALFAAAQARVALAGADHILSEAGLTAAEHARGGFFQLLAVAGLTMLLLGAVRGLVRSGSSATDRALRVMQAVVCLLTVVIVSVSIVRLGLYTDAFGQTTLRWYSTAFAWLLGALFVLLAVATLVRRFEAHLPAASVTVVLAVLLAVNVLNPEARVAQTNLDRAVVARTVPLDSDYLLRLSADAWPVLIANSDTVIAGLDPDRSSSPAERFAMRCGEESRSPGWGLLGSNVARLRIDCPR